MDTLLKFCVTIGILILLPIMFRESGDTDFSSKVCNTVLFFGVFIGILALYD